MISEPTNLQNLLLGDRLLFGALARYEGLDLVGVTLENAVNLLAAICDLAGNPSFAKDGVLAMGVR
jgi:hypothetical protein